MPIAAWLAWITHSRRFTESFIDELAHRAGIILSVPLELLHKHPRHQQVLQVAAKPGYGRNLPEGRAGHSSAESFGSICAEITEVSIGSDGKPVVHKVTAAIDCGWVVNPDTAKQ